MVLVLALPVGLFLAVLLVFAPHFESVAVKLALAG
jgi:hypothetical protein